MGGDAENGQNLQTDGFSFISALVDTFRCHVHYQGLQDWESSGDIQKDEVLDGERNEWAYLLRP